MCWSLAFSRILFTIQWKCLHFFCVSIESSVSAVFFYDLWGWFYISSLLLYFFFFCITTLTKRKRDRALPYLLYRLHRLQRLNWMSSQQIKLQIENEWIDIKIKRTKNNNKKKRTERIEMMKSMKEPNFFYLVDLRPQKHYEKEANNKNGAISIFLNKHDLWLIWI